MQRLYRVRYSGYIDTGFGITYTLVAIRLRGRRLRGRREERRLQGRREL
ncbi:MAG: hypothetical protein F6K47_18345 [Symploca sp. SIO2E6]|nr:hypothetical protein [Symploca sp. SIO2E6]